MQIPYGKVIVTTAGQPRNAGVNVTEVTGEPLQAQSITFQALPGNTGIIYIFVGMKGSPPADDRTNLAYCVAILSVPVSATQGPFASYTVTQTPAPAGLNVRDYWIDASAGTTNGVIVSGILG